MNAQAKFAARRAGRKNQRGAVVILVGLAMALLIGFAALAVDVSNLVVARNELQNGADAGALAGTRFLYTNNGQSVNTGANQIAFDAARANNSQRTAVEVNWTAGSNTGSDVERGHWSFGLGALPRGFTPNASTEPVALWDVSTAELDANTNFINAVRVNCRREATPVTAFFARIFGITDFEAAAEAVAWIGFAGSLGPGEADQPIALCKDKLLNAQGEFTCSVGRFIPSPGETGGWTNFTQVPEDASCGGAANANQIRDLVGNANNNTCSPGNPEALKFGDYLQTNNGQVQSAFDRLAGCWEAATGRTSPWSLTLPVVDCVGNNIAPCSKLVGAVTVEVVWIQVGQPDEKIDCTETQKNRLEKAAPCQMDDWDGSTIVDGNARWNAFATHFNLVRPDGSVATVANGGWNQKTIYFKPSCEPHEPTGTSEGENFGILAEIPRLVQ